jgi:DNA damage-binding protein 1
LDGDFLESFLNIIGEERRVERVYAGSSDPERLTLPVDDYRRALETLQSLH